MISLRWLFLLFFFCCCWGRVKSKYSPHFWSHILGKGCVAIGWIFYLCVSQPWLQQRPTHAHILSCWFFCNSVRLWMRKCVCVNVCFVRSCQFLSSNGCISSTNRTICTENNGRLLAYLFIEAHCLMLNIESNTNNFQHIECAISESFKRNILVWSFHIEFNCLCMYSDATNFW